MYLLCIIMAYMLHVQSITFVSYGSFQYGSSLQSDAGLIPSAAARASGGRRHMTFL